MTIDDYEDVVYLWEKTEGIGLSEADKRENIQVFLNRNKGLSYVYLEDNKIIGGVLCGHDGRRGYIHHLAVDKLYRGKKVGSELMETCLEALKNKGIEKCHLFVFNKNTLGQVFWKNTGWYVREDLLIYSKHV